MTEGEGATGNITEGEGGENITTSGGAMVRCCDYFYRGSGYEFSVCDGIGAIVRQELVGGEKDLMYTNMALGQSGPAWLWADLSGVANKYCQVKNQPMETSLIRLEDLWQRLDIPWAEWKNIPLKTIDDLRIWLTNHQTFLTQLQGLVGDFQNSELEGKIVEAINRVDPRLINSNVTFPELMSDFQAIFMHFGDWFKQFFGPGGLVDAKLHPGIQDGAISVDEVEVDLYSLPPQYFAIDSMVGVPDQFKMLGQWVLDRFGQEIMQGSCDLCQNLGGKYGSSSAVSPILPVIEGNLTEGGNTTAEAQP